MVDFSIEIPENWVGEFRKTTRQEEPTYLKVICSKMGTIFDNRTIPSFRSGGFKTVFQVRNMKKVLLRLFNSNWKSSPIIGTRGCLNRDLSIKLGGPISSLFCIGTISEALRGPHRQVSTQKLEREVR